MSKFFTQQPLDLARLMAETEHASCGGLAVFAGTVRDHHQGKAVERLIYTAYEPVAEKVIATVEQEAIEKFGVIHCRVIHRLGELGIGETAILAVVRSAHRREAFAACEYAIDQVKHRATVFKEEFYTDGTSAFVECACLHQPN